MTSDGKWPIFVMLLLTLCHSCAIFVLEVIFMEKSVRVGLTLSPGTVEKLDKICSEKGVKRPAVVSFAIDLLWKEEHAGEK